MPSSVTVTVTVGHMCTAVAPRAFQATAHPPSHAPLVHIGVAAAYHRIAPTTTTTTVSHRMPPPPPQARTKLEFAAPAGTDGAARLTLFFMCDSWLGCDQEYEINLKVAPNEDGPAAMEQ